MPGGHSGNSPALLLAAACLGLLALPCRAEVVLDGSLGRSGGLAGPNFAVTADLGRQVGGNLFHSFAAFNLAASEAATFSGPGSVMNIISRVTGGSASSIDGRIASTIPGANFFFLNPAGIVFGANASLDVSGSAHFSTGHYLGFADGAVFSASTDPSASTLTAAEPAAFGFLGRGSALQVNGASLAAGDGMTLSLSGGDVLLAGASLGSAGGGIELRAQDSGSVSLSDSTVAAAHLADRPPGAISIVGGQVTLVRSRVDSSNGAGSRAGEIVIASDGQLMMDGSTIESRASDLGDGGDIGVTAGDVVLANGSRINSITDWAGRGGSIYVNSAGPLVARGEDAFGNSSGIAANAESWGDAGNVQVGAQSIRLRNGAQIGSTSFGAGYGGTITLNATDEIFISGVNSAGYPSGVQANAYDTGEAGSISLYADRLTLLDGGAIGSSSYGDMALAGYGGAIFADIAGLLKISGVNANGRISGINATSEGPGSAGYISLTARQLQLLDGGQINSSAFGTSWDAGWGGYISISASDSTVISGVGRTGYPSALVAETYGPGDAGYIFLDTGALTLTDGGAISSGAFGTQAGAGSGGGVFVDVAGPLTVSGVHADGRISGIFAVTHGPGSAGFISLSAGELQLLDGAQIDSTSYGTMGGAGDGGYITIDVAGSTLISGVGHTGYPSALVAETQGTGNAGWINLATGSLTLSDGGTISGGTFGALAGAGNGGNISVVASGDIAISGVHGSRVSKIVSDSEGPGAAGSIEVSGRNIVISDGGHISSTAYGAGAAGFDWGLIDVTASESLRISGVNATSGHRSGIYTNSEGTAYAGDINIVAPRLELLDGGVVSSSALGTMPGAQGYGYVYVTSDSVLISGEGSDGFASGIYTGSWGPGSAGGIQLSANSLELRNGGRISSTANWELSDAGDSGWIDLTVRDDLTISGVSPQGNASGIYVQSYGPGRAGDIWLQAGRLRMDGGSEISSASYGMDSDAGGGGFISVNARRVELSGIGSDGWPTSINAVSTGPGVAGSIDIRASEALILSGGAEITTRTDEADGGNITLGVGELLKLTGSRITTSVGGGLGNGGNIDIDPTFVVLNNSVIQANAWGGNGGNIRIVTDHLVASTDSRIEASSQLGIDGSIEISSPNVDVGAGLMVLPSNYLDASLLLRDACAGSRGAAASSSFVGAGNGGLPAGPGGLFTSRYDEMLPAGGALPQARSGALPLSPLKLAFSCGRQS